MKKIAAIHTAFITAVSLFCAASARADTEPDRSSIEAVVNQAVRPVMKEHHLPGMAVAVTVRGQRHVFNYGVASKESGKAVSDDTIFEIGSVSKTFTAVLATYAQSRGTLSLADPVSKKMPALGGSSFDNITLLNLATYTGGGLPLQFPESVRNEKQMMDFYKNWRPAFAPGTHRLYSNPSIGLLGRIAAESMGKPYADAMEKHIFAELGLTRTYFQVPSDRMEDYAYGYSKDDKPIRVSAGVLDREAYGIKTTASDLIKYVEANIRASEAKDILGRAIAAIHTGYFKLGGMTQGLGWEMYDYPANLETLLEGNSTQVILQPNAIKRLDTPLPPRTDVLFNKTGSTNGQGAYVAFVPVKNIGVVMLANKYYPNTARVQAAHQILNALDSDTVGGKHGAN